MGLLAGLFSWINATYTQVDVNTGNITSMVEDIQENADSIVQISADHSEYEVEISSLQVSSRHLASSSRHFVSIKHFVASFGN